MLKLEDCICRSDDIVSRDVGGETVLLDLEAGTYFGLNHVGGRLWQLLEGGSRSLKQLCDELEREFEVDRSVLEADVVALANELQENGLAKIEQQ
ncbi:PqqD family protein [Aurantiacibacter sp. MUD11]|uniref:PqqD family protein n=1 Tax=Aurantiacibacter sp. MUD11 TaxID=3003265 RepID=UPI0022AB23FB|nr:PqqD family protein [Aurantiacibacter sp. MUD11]WAT17026.1 PqqD family protein [Aurantiacibacter sp. MUD11]